MKTKTTITKQQCQTCNGTGILVERSHSSITRDQYEKQYSCPFCKATGLVPLSETVETILDNGRRD